MKTGRLIKGIKIRDSDRNPHTYAHPVFIQKPEKYTLEKNNPQQMVLIKLDSCTYKITNGFIFSPYTKFISKLGMGAQVFTSSTLEGEADRPL